MSDLAASRGSRWVGPARLMLAVTAFTGLLGWVAILIAAQRLGPAGYARFSVIWGVLFGLAGAFSGFQQEVTRATYRGKPGDPPIWWRAALLVGSACALAGLVIAVGRPAGLGATPGQALLVVGALVGFGGMTFVNGVLAQREQWGWVAAVLGLDALLRTVAVIVVLDAGASGNATVVAVLGIGPFAWLALLGARTMRSALLARGAEPSRFAWRAASAMLAAGCTSVLVAGFPLLLALVSSRPLDATAGTLLAGLVLVRSPLLLVLFGLRPVFMRAFLGSSRPAQDLLRVWFWCAVATALGCVAALAIGRWSLATVMGEDFSLPGWKLSLMVLGSAELGMLTVSGLALIASNLHSWSTLGWLVALASTCLLLTIPTSTERVVLQALCLGPLGGLVVHSLALLRMETPKRVGAV